MVEITNGNPFDRLSDMRSPSSLSPIEKQNSGPMV